MQRTQVRSPTMTFNIFLIYSIWKIYLWENYFYLCVGDMKINFTISQEFLETFFNGFTFFECFTFLFYNFNESLSKPTALKIERVLLNLSRNTLNSSYFKF